MTFDNIRYSVIRILGICLDEIPSSFDSDAIYVVMDAQLDGA